MKEKWVKAIRAANNDNYEGGGFICEQHFVTEDIIHSSNRMQLKKGSIPSIFLVEIVEIVLNLKINVKNANISK